MTDRDGMTLLVDGVPEQLPVCIMSVWTLATMAEGKGKDWLETNPK
jgi:hypothetical protein